MRAPSKAYVRELQVGLFVVLACIIIALFSFKITQSPIFRRGTPLKVYLSDATGIFIDSKVKMAGIDIGTITGVNLEKGKARIDILINNGIQIPEDAKIFPRPLGILGDKFLEVQLPGEASEAGSEASTPSPEATRSSWLNWLIPSAYAQAPTAPSDSPTPATSKRVLKKGEVIKGVDGSVTLDDLARQLGSASDDLKDISKNVKTMVRDNKGEVTQMIHTLNRVSTKLEKTIDGFDEKKLHRDLKNLSDSVGNFGATLKNMESITKKIDQGEGTLGKLVNDTTTVNELNKTLATISQVVDRARRTLTIVDVNGEYAAQARTAKSYIGITIQPREDTAYIAQFIIDPRGYQTRKTVRTIDQTNGSLVSSQEIITNEKNDLKFSLQFMKRVDNLSVRLGLFESTGGFGLDYFFWSDRLQLTTEFFNWARQDNNGYLKAYAKVYLLNYVYLIVGGDDLLAKKNPTDSISKSFMGGIGLRFTDDDLKTMLALTSFR